MTKPKSLGQSLAHGIANRETREQDDDRLARMLVAARRHADFGKCSSTSRFNRMCRKFEELCKDDILFTMSGGKGKKVHKLYILPIFLEDLGASFLEATVTKSDLQTSISESNVFFYHPQHRKNSPDLRNALTQGVFYNSQESRSDCLLIWTISSRSATRRPVGGLFPLGPYSRISVQLRGFSVHNRNRDQHGIHGADQSSAGKEGCPFGLSQHMVDTRLI